MALSTSSIARRTSRHPWFTVVAWALLFVIGILVGGKIGTVLSTDGTFTNKPEAVKGLDLLEGRLRGPTTADEYVIVRSPDHTVDDANFRGFVERLSSELRTLTKADGTPAVRPDTVHTYYDSGEQSLVGPDQRTMLVPLTLAGDLHDAIDNAKPLVDLVSARNGREGFEVLTAGAGSIGKTFNETAESDLSTEMKTLPVALLILVVVFGALVAAGVPVGIGLLSIVMAVASATVVGQAFDLSFFVINMITMIGLAVGIDYTLFIVERFREERRLGRSIDDAIFRAADTATRAVVFSGITVVIALAGMFLVPTTIFRSLAVGAIGSVVWAIITSVTLVPAVLKLLGDRINAPRLRFIRRKQRSESSRGFWARATHIAVARPWASVAITGGLLIAATIPYFGIRLGSSGPETLPSDTMSGRAFQVMQDDFSLGLLSPVEVVVDPSVANDRTVNPALARLTERLAGDGVFGTASVEWNKDGTLADLSTTINAPSSGEVAQDAIRRLREQYIPESFAGSEARVYVTGDAAFNRDFFDAVGGSTPRVFAFVLGLSFILLLLAFRSIVVPAKAVLMNLLSVGAAYGLLVLVFQHGVGADFLGFRQVEAIDAWIPLFMFSVLFGLSMDYHVFLLSRIREHYDQTGDNRESVETGLRSTARIITGAALIMVVVFAGFAMGELAMFQQVGFGLAVAVILDATVVRMVLVPASMELLGARNWYLPRWLRWLPDLRVEGDVAAGARAAVQVETPIVPAPAGSPLR